MDSDIRNVAQIVEGKGGDLERLLWERPERSEEAYFARSRDMTHDMQEALTGPGSSHWPTRASRSADTRAAGDQSTSRSRPAASTQDHLGDALSLVAQTPTQQQRLMATKDGQEFQTQRARQRIRANPVEVESIRKQVDPDGKYVRLIEDFKASSTKPTRKPARWCSRLTGIGPGHPKAAGRGAATCNTRPRPKRHPSEPPILFTPSRKNMGVWKDRVQTTSQPIVLVDLSPRCTAKSGWLAKTIESAEPVRDASMVLLDRKVREAVVSQFGLDHYNDMKSRLGHRPHGQGAYQPRAKAVSVLNSIAATKRTSRSTRACGWRT